MKTLFGLDKNELAGIAVDAFKHADYYYYSSSGGLTTLRFLDGSAPSAKDKSYQVRCALSLMVQTRKEGTPEWVKALVFEVDDGEQLTDQQELDLAASLRKAVLGNPCLKGDEDLPGPLKPFGCSGDSPSSLVVPHVKAGNKDCEDLDRYKYHLLIPRYVASKDGTLHPREVWASRQPFKFAPGSPEARLREITDRTCQEATGAARLLFALGNPSPQPFLAPRAMALEGFPVDVQNNPEPMVPNQYVRFGISGATPVSMVKLIVYGPDEALVAETFRSKWNQPNVPGLQPDHSMSVDVYRCSSDGPVLEGSGVQVAYLHQPNGILQDAITSIGFTGNRP